MYIKTIGFLEIESFLNKNHVSPFTAPYKNAFILLLILFLMWTIYPIIQKLNDPRIGFSSYLLDIFVFLMHTNFLLGALSFTNDRGKLIILINNLSNFNRFGIPTELRFVDNFIKNGFKYTRYVSYGYIVVWNILLLRKNCFNNNPHTCYLLFNYYIPYKLQPWLEGFLVVREMFLCAATFKFVIGGVGFIVYAFELIIIRLRHITMLVNQIKFEIGDKKSLKLRSIMMYHQEVCGLFHICCNVFGKVIVLQRFCTVGLIVLNASVFALQYYMFICYLLIGSLLILAICNTVGQRIIDANDSLAEAIYNMNWYDADLKLKRDILIFLLLSQRTFNIKFGVLGSVSYSAMTEDLNKCYGWFRTISTLISQKKY